MRRLSSSILMTSPVVCTALAGCAAGNDEATAVEAASEVRTASCPADVLVRFRDLQMRSVFPGSLSRDDAAAVEGISRVLAAEGDFGFRGNLVEKASGRCTYQNDTAERAVLYTRGGEDIFRVDIALLGRTVHVFASPSSYAGGLSFQGDATARFSTNLAGPSARPEWIELGTARVAAGEEPGVPLANGSETFLDDRPEGMRVSVPVGGATATVVDQQLAFCEATKNEAMSGDTQTVFDLTWDYEIDDGWNGCTFAFDGPGFHAKLEGGFSVED